MHKKALSTPVGVLKGSANLTESGSQHNEEMIDHFFFGTTEYDQARINIQDTFQAAGSGIMSPHYAAVREGAASTVASQEPADDDPRPFVVRLTPDSTR